MGSLRGWMGSVREWLQGKKSILGGCVVIAAAVAGAFTGKLQPMDAVGVAGFGFSLCGMAAKANRHQSELISALSDIGALGMAARTPGLGRAEAVQTAVDSLAKQAVAAAVAEVPAK